MLVCLGNVNFHKRVEIKKKKEFLEAFPKKLPIYKKTSYITHKALNESLDKKQKKAI